MPRGRTLSNVRIDRLRKLFDEGLTDSIIAERLRMNNSSVRKYTTKWRKHETRDTRSRGD